MARNAWITWARKRSVPGLCVSAALGVALAFPVAASASARGGPETCGTVSPKSAPRSIKTLRVIEVTGMSCSQAEKLIADLYVGTRRSPSGTSMYFNFSNGFTCLLSTGVGGHASTVTCRRGSSYIAAVAVS